MVNGSSSGACQADVVEQLQATITGAASAFPPAVAQNDLWDGYFRRHYSDSAIARRLFTSAGVDQRHAVVNPIIEDLSGASTEVRMRRYLPEALPLATSAVRKALDQTRVDACDVGLFVVASCTGYASPGLDTFVARDTGMSSGVQRLSIGHMGCYAALPGIAAATDYVTARQRPAVVVCVELSSLHIQPSTTDTEQMVGHALFSDAASSIVVEPGARSGLRVVDLAASMQMSDAELMTWDITDLGFRMGLSQKIPDALRRCIVPVVDELLARNYLTVDDIEGWAVHPGGPRVLDVVGESLKLQPEQLSESRAVLAEHGNCSSATLLVVLDEVRRQRHLEPGRHVVAMAFGPGLTLYVALLRAT